MTKPSSHEISKAVDKVISELYAKFAKYSIRNVHGVCTECCLGEPHLTQIKKHALKSLSAVAIREYLDAAQSNIDVMVSEIKYLLPRILELFNQGAEIRLLAELNFDKLNLNRSDLWQADEIALIKSFAKLHFESLFVKDDSAEYFSLAEVVMMWDLAGLETLPLLDCWQQNAHHPKAIIEFVELLYGLTGFYYNSHNINGSTDHTVAWDINTWATSSKVIGHFQEAIYANLDAIDDLSESALFGYEYLLNYRLKDQ